MDNALQNSGTVSSPRFRITAYGLIVNLLYANVPLFWVIRTGKQQHHTWQNYGVYNTSSQLGFDFSAPAQMICPRNDSTTWCGWGSNPACPTLSFAGGPFVIRFDQVPLALPVIQAFGVTNSVSVYQLMADTVMDVRQTLTQKPLIGVLNSGGNWPIPAGYCSAAGLTLNTHYKVMSLAQARGIDGNVCVTMATEPHYSSTDPAFQSSMLDFLKSGGNFLAECEAIDTYETNIGGAVTDAGIVVVDNLDTNLMYESPDTPYGQFDGIINGLNSGSVSNFRLRAVPWDAQPWWPGTQFASQNQSHFYNNAHSVVRRTNSPIAVKTNPPRGLYSNPPAVYHAIHGKLTRGAVGGNIFFIASHDFSGGPLNMDNGVRMFMNAMLSPATRPPICGFSIVGCPTVVCPPNEVASDDHSCACICDTSAAVFATCIWPQWVDTATCSCLTPSANVTAPPAPSITVGAIASTQSPAAIPPVCPSNTNCNQSPDKVLAGVLGGLGGAALCLALAAALIARRNRKEKKAYDEACQEGMLALGDTGVSPLYGEYASARQNPLYANEADADIDL